MAAPDKKEDDLDFERAKFDTDEQNATQQGDAQGNSAEQGDSALAQQEQPAEPTGPLTCRSCQRGIFADYYKANDVAFCPRCHDEIQRQITQGTEGATLRAVLFGVGGAVLGAALYYLVMAISEWELGIVAIVVGILVGKGVRRGAGLHRHWLYPALGIGLSYLAIAATYVPGVLDAFNASTLTPAEGSSPTEALPATDLSARTLSIAFFTALLVPVLRLINFELMGPIILAISLWEGWRYAKAPKIEFSGPMRQGAG